MSQNFTIQTWDRSHGHLSNFPGYIWNHTFLEVLSSEAKKCCINYVKGLKPKNVFFAKAIKHVAHPFTRFNRKKNLCFVPDFLIKTPEVNALFILVGWCWQLSNSPSHYGCPYFHSATEMRKLLGISWSFVALETFQQCSKLVKLLSSKWVTFSILLLFSCL